MTEAIYFPSYSTAERQADACVHLLGVLGSLVGAATMMVYALGALQGLALVSVAVYSAGLVTVLSSSAAYNLVSEPGLKAILRRLDHSAIFVMIAGTYTPFVLVSMGGAWGLGLFVLVWVVAAAGVAMKLLLPHRFERIAVLLYLTQGWAVLPAIEPLIAAVSGDVLTLLVAGGLFYTGGVGFHLWERLPFQNVIWHALVLAGAACHYAAVMQSVVFAGG